ncbi:MAG TPA: DUF2917 domain-containing protein [Casimicrobiaceae bacterium]|nr:DUF2917 domain-containing protein [Casimicrobiaceae bacterium]
MMNNRLLTLNNGDLLELPDARGTTLRMTRGSLWVTQERDWRDIVLAEGDVWTIERGGLTAGEARGDVTVVVTGNALAHAIVRVARPSWSARVAAWIERAGERHLRRTWVPHV